MSLDLVGWAFDQQGVPATQRAVLVRLAWHADRETQRCWPSLTHLAKKNRLRPKHGCASDHLAQRQRLYQETGDTSERPKDLLLIGWRA